MPGAHQVGWLAFVKVMPASTLAVNQVSRWSSMRTVAVLSAKAPAASGTIVRCAVKSVCPAAPASALTSAVCGSELVPAAQPDLFAPAEPPSDQRLDAALDEIRNRFGTAALIRAGWAEGSFDTATELAIVQKDASYLTPESDAARLDALLAVAETGIRRLVGLQRRALDARAERTFKL